jgi:phosphate transport system substrate-binding protein
MSMEMLRATFVSSLVLLASPTKAQEVGVDPSLPLYRPVAGVVGVIRGHASGGAAMLMLRWGRGFQRIYPNARVALDDAVWEDVRGGAATFGPYMFMAKHRIEEFERHFGYVPTRIPVYSYTIAVYVHKANPCREGLRIEEVENIFSARYRDKLWGDLGCEGEWSKRPISLYAPKFSPNRAWHYLRNRFGLGFTFKDSVRWRFGDAAVVSSVAEDASGIGLAVIGCQTDKVRALPIAPEGSPKFVPATAENVWKGAYPLARFEWLLLNHDFRAPGLELDPLRREFLRYILSREGQQAVIKAGFVALSAKTAEHALAKARLTPTGKGSWYAMMSRLRARGLPHQRMNKIEYVARNLGDRPTHERLVEFSKMLASTGLTSSVALETEEARRSSTASSAIRSARPRLTHRRTPR